MSRATSVDDRVLLGRLATVFRAEGYTGASLAALAQASGLQKASLYHRFPGGKPAMALAVFADIDEMLAEVLSPLTGVEPVADAVAEMARRLASSYTDGRLSCALDTMTLEGAPADIKTSAATLARRWIDAMAHAATRAGASVAEAESRARSALVQVQGALVVSRVLDDPSEFDRVLSQLPSILTGADR